jgi:tetratricopeptide (TPR) repeat protein
VGTVEVGKTQLHLGRLLLSLRRIWPFGGVEGIVTGSVQTYGQLTRIVARIEYGSQISAWEVTKKSISIESIPQETIRELAYKVAFEILSKERSPAGTWEAFRDITEAISRFIKYFRTQSIDELRKSDEYLQAVRKDDCKLVKQEGKKSEILADLFYKISLAYLLQNDYSHAEKNMKQALEVDSNRENYHYYYNGLGNIYWKQKKSEDANFVYNRSIRHLEDLRKNQIFKFRIVYRSSELLSYFHFLKETPQRIKQKALIFPYPYNGVGNLKFEKGEFKHAEKCYKHAIKEDKKFWKPYHNLGNIYLYSDGLFDRPNNYNSAIEHFKLAVKLSRHQGAGSAMSHSGLGLAYFFKAIASQSELSIAYQRASSLNDYGSLDTETLSIVVVDTKEAKEFLEQALDEAQLAIDLDGESASSGFYWNLGLIELWHSRLDKVQSIWEKAIYQAQQEKHDLCYAIYSYANQAISPHESASLSRYMERVNSCLQQQAEQETISQGNIKMILKDLSVVRIALLRYLCKNISAAGGYNDNLENQRILRASRHITNLQERLQTALRNG